MNKLTVALLTILMSCCVYAQESNLSKTWSKDPSDARTSPTPTAPVPASTKPSGGATRGGCSSRRSARPGGSKQNPQTISGPIISGPTGKLTKTPKKQLPAPLIPPIGSKYKHKWDAARQADLPVPQVKLGDPPIDVIIGNKKGPSIPDDDDGEDPRDTPPPVFFGEEIETESDSIVYVIDISGSMRTNNRLKKAKKELERSLKGLAINMRFNVIAFDCAMSSPFKTLIGAWPPNVMYALDWIRQLFARGGTGTGPAVAEALRMDRENLSIILLTDGGPNCGVPYIDIMISRPNGTMYFPKDGWQLIMERHKELIKRNNLQGAAIHVFGIDATDNSFGAFRSWCQSVANESGGSYIDVP